MAKVLERSLYETDHYAWTRQQAAELRRLAEVSAPSTLDLDNLAEEIESLGRSDLNTVRSHVRRIIEHLLKLERSPAASRACSGSSRSTRRATRSPTVSPHRCARTPRRTSPRWSRAGVAMRTSP